MDYAVCGVRARSLSKHNLFGYDTTVIRSLNS